MATKSRTAAPTKTPPVTEYKSGGLKVAVWLNQSERGNFHSVTIVRSYRTAQGEWKDTGIINAQDLPALSKLLEMAYSWIREQQAVTA